ncbi:MAG: 23S rRNA (guanosine(2251)-2'-O)-methyltransferase RlmB [Desulfobulbus sp.]|jgi:23S rRNA (guanosine2251-2'-O)-methyltransferase
MADGQRGAAAAPEDPDLLWGVHAVWEALSQEDTRIGEVLIQRGKAGLRLQQIIEQARERRIPVRFVEADRMRVPRQCRHQGVVARQSGEREISLNELLDGLEAEPSAAPPRLLLLDSIQDPGNLGAILRSALAAGFSRVIMPRDRSAPISGAVVRSSAGATSHLQLCRTTNLSTAIESLKKRGFWIYGAVTDSGAQSIYEADFSGPVGLIIGSEGKGIRPLVRRHCDVLITIPMQTPFNSLNAAAAAAVIMFEIARRSL